MEPRPWDDAPPTRHRWPWRSSAKRRGPTAPERFDYLAAIEGRGYAASSLDQTSRNPKCCSVQRARRLLRHRRLPGAVSGPSGGTRRLGNVVAVPNRSDRRRRNMTIPGGPCCQGAGDLASCAPFCRCAGGTLERSCSFPPGRGRTLDDERMLSETVGRCPGPQPSRCADQNICTSLSGPVNSGNAGGVRDRGRTWRPAAGSPRRCPARLPVVPPKLFPMGS